MPRTEQDNLQSPSVVAGLQVLIQSVLVPAILARSDVKGSLSRLRDSYSARHLGADPAGVFSDPAAAAEALTQHLQRVPRTRNKARERLRSISGPQVEADLAAWIHANRGLNVPAHALAEAVHQSGWLVLSTTLGKHLRSLLDAGIIENGPNRTYRAADGRAAASLEADRQVHLSRWLGSLTRTVLQRFQRSEGSALWVLRMILAPADFQNLVRAVHEDLRVRLDGMSQRPLDLSEQDADAWVLFAPSLLSAPEGFQPPADHQPGWASDLLLAAVGGDVGLRIGDVSTADEVLQREVIDALLDAAESAGEDPKHFIAERYGLRSPNTILAWRGGRRFGRDGDRIASTAQVNLYRVQIGHILSAAWPSPVPWSRLLERLRKLDPQEQVPDPAMVELALSQMASDDILKRVPGREQAYGLQRPDYKVSVEQVEAMRESMGQDLRAVPAMVAAVECEHPAAEVRSGVWCIRRDQLPEVKAWLRDAVQRQWQRFSSSLPAPPTPDSVGEDYCEGRLIVQMRVSPIMHVSRR